MSPEAAAALGVGLVKLKKAADNSAVIINSPTAGTLNDMFLCNFANMKLFFSL